MAYVQINTKNGVKYDISKKAFLVSRLKWLGPRNWQLPYAFS